MVIWFTLLQDQIVEECKDAIMIHDSWEEGGKPVLEDEERGRWEWAVLLHLRHNLTNSKWDIIDKEIAWAASRSLTQTADGGNSLAMKSWD